MRFVVTGEWTRNRLLQTIVAHLEAARAAAREPSGMVLKMNSLEDPKIIRRLYDASVAGVPIDIIVRGICRLIREGVKIYDGKVGSLRRFKDDAREVNSGFECGIGIDGYNDIKVGDVIETFTLEEKPATLE